MYLRGSETTRIQRLTLLFVFAYSVMMVWSCDNTTLSCPPEIKLYCKCENNSAKCNQSIFGNMSLLPCNLKKFVVEKSELKELQNEIFQLPMLEYLDLSYNKLDTKRICPYAFQDLTRLVTLDLRYNTKIYRLKKVWFNDLYSLVSFYAQNCRISNLNETIFENSPNIKYVILANNKLNYLHEELFTDLEYLEVVDLKGNSLFTFHANAFSGSFELQRIILRQNKFTTLRESFGIQDLHELAELDLRENQIACDCDIRWFHAWLQHTNASVKASCYWSSNMIGPRVKEFDTSTLHCTIQVWVVVVISVVSLSLLILLVVVLYRLNIRKIYHRLSLRWHYKQVS